MNRSEFMLTAAAAISAVSVGRTQEKTMPKPPASKLPRWRGFNLLEKFTAENNAPFRESDFAWMAEWGFDFARLPLSYLCWSGCMDLMDLNGMALSEIDQAVEFGRKHNIHVNLNFHRAPGYCVNPP